MGVATEIPPWGECVTEGCHITTIRCYWGKCPEHCAKLDKDPTGTMLHAARPAAEIKQVTPFYLPSEAKLIGTMIFKEEAA